MKKFSLDPERKTILVLGGSQGSQKLNEVFFDMISSWGRDVPIQAIHMTGTRDYSLYAAKYKDRFLPVKAYEFIDPIEEVYGMTDVVIARAGAATVSELGFFALPCVLVPYPLADGHQKYNANVLLEAGLAKIIEQKDLTTDCLTSTVRFMLEEKKERKPLFTNNPAYELALAVENL